MTPRLLARGNPQIAKGDDDDGWFLRFRCFTRYVKVTFFRGASRQPAPPGASKRADVRYLDVHEHDTLDEEQFTTWVGKVSRLPGNDL